MQMNDGKTDFLGTKMIMFHNLLSSKLHHNDNYLQESHTGQRFAFDTYNFIHSDLP